MTIEISYWDMFWIGLLVGWVLCWFLPKLLNLEKMSHEERQEMYDMETLGYLPVPEFKPQPTQYFKHVPVTEIRLSNEGRKPTDPNSQMPPLKKPEK